MFTTWDSYVPTTTKKCTVNKLLWKGIASSKICLNEDGDESDSSVRSSITSKHKQHKFVFENSKPYVGNGQKQRRKRVDRDKSGSTRVTSGPRRFG